MFYAAMAIGLLLIRIRRKRSSTPPSEFRAWYVVVGFFLAVQIYLLIMPWFPPKGGIYAGDVSFFYATYCLVGVAM